MSYQKFLSLMMDLTVGALFLVACAAPTPTQAVPTPEPEATATPAPPTLASGSLGPTLVPPTAMPSLTSTPKHVELGETVTDGNWGVTCSSSNRAESVEAVADLEGGVLMPGTITINKEGLSFLLVECTVRNATSETTSYTLADIHTNSTPQDGLQLVGIDIARGASDALMLIPPEGDGWALLSKPMTGPGSGYVFYFRSLEGEAVEPPISVAPEEGSKRVFLFVLKDEATNVSFQFRDLPSFHLDE
ncbi:MAG: hypothetical protein ACE5JU_25125 [Candidatus Binatia bacterium]